MRDKIYYYDHNNMLKLTLNDYPYYSEPSEFKDWTWGYNNQFGKLNTFFRNKETWPLVIGIAGDYLPAHDALCDIFSADVLAEKPGKLVLRDWTLRCFITEAQYAYGTYTTELDRQAVFNVRAVDSTWIRETTRTFNGIGSGGSAEDLWRDYVNIPSGPGRGYNYGYNIPAQHNGSVDVAGRGNGYKLVIYGPAVDPVVYFDNHPVQVFLTLDEGDRLEIVSNGETKTIEVIKPNGFRYNAFVYRSKEYSPFIEINDHVDLSWGDIKFDFTTIERRSEPTWI